MSLKEKLSKSWQNTKKSWKESSERAKERNHAREGERHFRGALASQAYEDERREYGRKHVVKTAKARARGEIKRPSAFGGGFTGFGNTPPMFASGLFSEPMGIRKPRTKRVRHKKGGKTIYVNGVEIRTGSRPSHRRRTVHRRKSQNPFGFGEGLF